MTAPPSATQKTASPVAAAACGPPAPPAPSPWAQIAVATANAIEAPVWRSSMSVPMAAPMRAGATMRLIAICRPEKVGPIPRPSSAMNTSDCQSGVDASNVAKPTAPSAATANPTSSVTRNSSRRTITAAPTLTATTRPSSSG